ncbi:hypothetical protein BB558_000106 [Smittium angustum]|uniref:Peptidase C14 caspase domain-containing protein n=1 Tax=Smittium angustum TaxID=133377 RepID=A0A2U1JF51_SMIAN|nr:hypothetical protein BB558_000325 [Smittium angustum]PWA03717.1 hypothetical protein BB558_000106 [Smittium angustum]
MSYNNYNNGYSYDNNYQNYQEEEQNYYQDQAYDPQYDNSRGINDNEYQDSHQRGYNNQNRPPSQTYEYPEQQTRGNGWQQFPGASHNNNQQYNRPPQNDYEYNQGMPQVTYPPVDNFPQDDYNENYTRSHNHQSNRPPPNNFPQNDYNDNYGRNNNQGMPQASRPPPNEYGNGGYNQGNQYQQMPPPLNGNNGSNYGSYYEGGGGWGEAPAANIPVPVVNYNEINYGGMEFPTFQGGNNAPQYDGINYVGSKFRLRGCINDVHRMKKFIMEHFGFKEADMVILTDDQKNPNRLPTRENILKAMKWLVSDAKMNDSFFFHYSGHGSRVEDKSGDELDGEDETICPLDFEKNGQIIDDDMNMIMVRPLPPGARLTAIFDCCHSGSALDLPFTYGANGKLKKESGLKISGSSLKDAGTAYLKGDVESALSGLTFSLKALMTGDQKLAEAKEKKSSLGDVVMFSGCKDTQTSADAKEDLSFTGAMSFALTSSLYAKPRQTYVELLNDIRQRLSGKYTQVPQLSTGRLMDMNTTFIM